MEKTYNPKELEAELYQNWERSGAFKPTGKGEPFTIVIPPPNVTGQLHIGHALDHTLQDILIRTKRMQGHDTLWVPGTDHAGIATQNVVEKQLAESGKTRHDFGRDAFIEKVWEWKAEYGGRITNQMRRLGNSVDWSRERFTMDDGCQNAVAEHFVKLYNDGLIYRGKRIINWCPRCLTALSDIEVDHQEKDGKIWHIQYNAEDGTKIVVATTRPETMFGDTAIAVHPKDSRYQHLIGKQVTIPISNRNIPIIADDHVDKDFGSGAVKVTPAHDPNDFEIGERHNLDRILVFDESAIMNENAPEQFRGLDRYKCRNALISALESTGALIKTVPHTNNVGSCYRCKTVVEPYLSSQWFVNMQQLATNAIRVVKDGTITFVPERFDKLYFNWMENIRDWCISRQIWWGHQIPVYYKKDAPGEFIVSATPPENADDYVQDEDVLDTWFSSALWPFSTLGWPNQTDDYKRYYPTSVLVTGYDIITFWVSRMISMGLHETEQAPFHTVYIHGLVRDIDGKKMSKSLGNVMDPLVLIDQFGADALRFALASHCTLGGQDIKFSEEKVESCRNFANKVWNVSRFLLTTVLTEVNIQPQDLTHPHKNVIPDPHKNVIPDPHKNVIPDSIGDPTTKQTSLDTPPKANTLFDQWILSRYATTVEAIETAFNQYNFAAITDLLWEFTWNDFCDWYVEASKLDKQASAPILIYILGNVLKLLHPYMPFITEGIWKLLSDFVQPTQLVSNTQSPFLMLASYPTAQPQLKDPKAEKDGALLIEIIRSVRNIRASLNVPPKTACELIVDTRDANLKALILANQIAIQKLARVSNISLDATAPEQSATAAIGSSQLFIPLAGLIDLDAERNRLEKQREKLDKEFVSLNEKLTNKNFTDKAPKHVVDDYREKMLKAQNELKTVADQIAALA
ncbi:MAG: valine--tRNA ligase [bacterium]|nr:valine--tRNA ligase [bacterium]